MTVSNRPVRVMCVDDNRHVAEAVELRIRFEPGIEWVGWVSATDTLSARVGRDRPDVILLDIDMPGRDAFDLLRELAEHSPSARTIMFSGYVRSDYIERALDAGAWGYVSKNDSTQDFLDAIFQ